MTIFDLGRLYFNTYLYIHLQNLFDLEWFIKRRYLYRSYPSWLFKESDSTTSSSIMNTSLSEPDLRIVGVVNVGDGGRVAERRMGKSGRKATKSAAAACSDPRAFLAVCCCVGGLTTTTATRWT